ncbi:hypothetical protein [Cyanobium sp. CH-040]|uniref:hypothetical protein n=1 Tax=Cyanobium sp. CH-040 TaxID=2823708 RepID=UPI0020CE5721|nr:hypothetical protein [Cyanobium sp. CH-040]MCP9926352.1 hypothetical protein [Cyanobium sp. CH-040]
MNLVEVLVAGSLVLGSATGSLGIWARSAHSSLDADQLLRQQREADAALLAVQARLQALAARQPAAGGPAPATCPQPAELLPAPSPRDAAAAGADPELALVADGSGRIVTATVQAGEGQPRTRRFDLAVYGLCAPAGGTS